MNRERIVIIVLLASLLVTNLGWIYMAQSQHNEPTDEFEMKLQELRKEKCNLRLFYIHSFEQTSQTSGYRYSKVNWGTFKQKIADYKERKGVKAVTVYPEEEIFDVIGENYTQHYYYKIG